MKKVNKNRIITAGIILAIIIIAYFSLRSPTPETDEEIIQCIGKKATLYTQEGCSHCLTQKNLFGENSIYINEIDCTANWNQCQNIRGTPSWTINNEQYLGVQSIEKLQELTGC